MSLVYMSMRALRGTGNLGNSGPIITHSLYMNSSLHCSAMETKLAKSFLLIFVHETPGSGSVNVLSFAVKSEDTEPKIQ